MCVCVCVCVLMHAHVCVFVHNHACMCVCVCVCFDTCPKPFTVSTGFLLQIDKYRCGVARCCVYHVVICLHAE